jgi:predicted kinase
MCALDTRPVASLPTSLPLVLIVTGPPCAGKTTLARHVAASLGLPLMTKDTIKEVLFRTLGWSDRAWSQRLGGASMELLYAFVEAQVAAGHSCVVEANFDAVFATPEFRDLRSRFSFLPVQVNCVADPAVLAARFHRRAWSGERHPGHQDHVLGGKPIPGRLPPLEIGGEVIELDTSDLARIDEKGLCERIRRVWRGQLDA